MATRLLVTGFVPFGPHAVNPSEQLLRPLAESAPGGAIVSTRVLPVVYRDAFAPVREALESERLDAVLLMGLGADRTALSFERLAVNWRASTTPDNSGVRVDGERIDPAGPSACFATVPVERLVGASLRAGVPAAPSRDAGTYLCNQVLYQTLRHCGRRRLRVRVGFLHLPPLPEQVTDGRISMEAGRMLTGVVAALAELAALPPPDDALTPDEPPDEMGV